jgi:hypothetical protein
MPVALHPYKASSPRTLIEEAQNSRNAADLESF